MTRAKRAFDLGFLLLSLPLMVPLAAIVTLLHLFMEGRPLIYRALRVGQDGQPFHQFKFRTLRAEKRSDQGVSGGYKTQAISRFAQGLRRCRLDELPQLVNILRGEMSWVGPRPPDPTHVAARPDHFARVLQSRPGLTGLATLLLHRYEDRLLRDCQSHQETEAVYLRRCLPKKLKLDLIYQRRLAKAGAIWVDLWLISKSVAAVLRRPEPGQGPRAKRRAHRPKPATIRTV